MNTGCAQSAACPSFCNHVLDIVFSGALEEVVRPNASAAVASVATVHTGRHRPDVHSVRDAMSVACLAITWIKPPIAVRGYFSHPDPAGSEVRALLGDGTVLINSRPEANAQRRLDVVAVALARAESAETVGSLADNPVALATGDIGNGRLTTHRQITPAGVMPSAVCTGAGALSCKDYTRWV